MRIAKVISMIVLLPVLLAVSCSKSREDILVAEVADRGISLATFEKTYLAVDPKYLPEDEGLEGLKEFLDTMINKEVLAMKADELGYDKDQYVVQGMEAFKKVSLQAGYLKIKVADRIKVTEKDLKKAYEKFGTNLQIKQILVDTKEEGDEVYELLQQGHDFEAVCKQYSKGPDASIGGNVVNALYGTFEPNFQDALFDTPVGGFTPPLLSRYGYFVVKVVATSQPKRKTFEQVRPDLEKLVQQQQELRLTTEVSDGIREKYGFEWYEDNIRIAFDALPPDRPLTNPPDRSAEVYPLLEFDAADLDKPLVSYKDKSITIKDFSDLYDRASFFARPRLEFRFGGVKKFLLDLVMNELVEDEMKASNIEEEPEVADMLRRKKEQFMVDKLFQDLVDKQTEVSPHEQDAYYQDNLERFRRPEQRRMGMILTNDRTTAMEAYNKVMAGERFERVSEEYSIEELTREERSGTDFVGKGQKPDYDEVAFGMENVGDVSQPFQTSRGWMVLKLIERRPESILPLSEARDEIRRALKQVKNEERLNSLLEKWRAEVEIKVYEKNLLKANIKERPKKTVSFT
ncbi:MAG: peptidyl-prolyl cis-trans isomerase [Candidatus Latescibacterota bacterium]|nr:MAG: peptidyl-prolyl cis-trans isomerase [Candidatus Latescibacterota bacterium]